MSGKLALLQTLSHVTHLWPELMCAVPNYWEGAQFPIIIPILRHLHERVFRPQKYLVQSPEGDVRCL